MGRAQAATADGAAAAPSGVRSPEILLGLVAKTAKRIAQLQDLDSLMPELVAAVQETFSYDFVSLLLVDQDRNVLVKTEVYGLHREKHIGVVRPISPDHEGGIVGWVAYHRTPLLVRDVREDPRYFESVPEARCELAVPLMTSDKVIGVIDVESVHVGGLDHRDQSLLETLADQFAIVIENARLYSDLGQAKRELQERTKQLERLLGGTLQLQEEERARISRDLHDGLVQLLVGALYQLDTARTTAARVPARSESALRRLHRLLVQCVDEIDYIVHDLRPLVLDDLGLRSAIERYAYQIGLDDQQFSIEVRGSSERLGSRVETAVYRIVQEALANAAKHGEASTISVELARTSDALTVTLEDDGIGFDYDDRVGGGLGLLSMQERAAGLGARFDVRSAPGDGTTVTVVVPVADEEAHVAIGDTASD